MIDRIKVMQLYRRGRTQDEISRTINCSRIQVQRIISNNLTLLDKQFHYYAKKGQESWFWFVLYCNGERISRISHNVGLTPQAIHQAIDNMTLPDRTSMSGLIRRAV